MSETLKDTLMKIELASKSYDKYENGMETFEWNDLYELNCYIEELQQRIDKAIEYAHTKLGFLENCVGGEVSQINQEIAIHQKYLSILQGKEME